METLDLGYRWMAGIVTDDEVISEICCSTNPDLLREIAEADMECERELADAREAERSARRAFTWLLGGPMPHQVKSELVRIYTA